MGTMFVTVLTPEELKNLFKECLLEHEAMKASALSVEQTYSINQVAKKLGRSHDTIRKLVRDGTLKTTSDNKRITARSLNDYLLNNPQK